MDSKPLIKHGTKREQFYGMMEKIIRDWLYCHSVAVSSYGIIGLTQHRTFRTSVPRKESVFFRTQQFRTDRSFKLNNYCCTQVELLVFAAVVGGRFRSRILFSVSLQLGYYTYNHEYMVYE